MQMLPAIILKHYDCYDLLHAVCIRGSRSISYIDQLTDASLGFTRGGPLTATGPALYSFAGTEGGGKGVPSSPGKNILKIFKRYYYDCKI